VHKLVQVRHQESYYILSTRLHGVTLQSIMCLTVPAWEPQILQF